MSFRIGEKPEDPQKLFMEILKNANSDMLEERHKTEKHEVVLFLTVYEAKLVFSYLNRNKIGIK